ncbi:hypothetical protein HD806DRAFT_13344 [Xylariaceae sp. AK1471]|nr:hypothetical protein HD806DRAFT_13344 [Xylariaceae sp. AK1471]
MLEMRPTQPPLVQPVWTLHQGRLPGKSHFPGHHEGGWFPLFQGRLVDASVLQQMIMDDQGLYQQHEIDSGDESCSLNDYYAEGLPMVGMGMPNVRSQTNAQSVSLANRGRDVCPSHPQYSNKAIPGNEQMFFPDHPAANAYAQDLAGGFHQQQFQYPSYNPMGLGNPSLDINYQHGLPLSTEVYSNMPVFAEPFECSHVSPVTLNSSFSSSNGSSIASERMASMTLEPGPSQGCTPPMDFRSNHHHASTTNIQGHSWAENCPATISPKMLRINPSPTPTSSSESIQTGIQTAGGDSDLGASAWDQQQARSVLPTKRSNHKARKGLPTKPIKSRLAPSPPRESATLKGKGKARAQKHSHQSALRLLDPAPAKPMPKGHLVAEVRNPVETVPSNSADAERDAKDRFLVESRLAGMTYREIRALGNFEEAESTLRGRFRAKTKPKEQRVRSPKWQEKDVSYPKDQHSDEIYRARCCRARIS